MVLEQIKRFIIPMLLLLFIGGAKGWSDTTNFHYSKAPAFMQKKPTYWKMSESWKNKYKNRDISQGEAFLGSTTIFVALTDGWHLLQELMLWAIAGMSIYFLRVKWYYLLLYLLLARMMIGLGFYLTYT